MPGNDSTFKYIAVGDSGVGKTCLLDRFVGMPFKPKYVETIGLQDGSHKITVDSQSTTLHLLEIAGSGNSAGLMRAYYSSAVGCLLVYDVTRRETFQNLSARLHAIKSSAHPQVVVTLVANKVDLDAKRTVTTEEGERFARDKGLIYMETSAKTASNVEETFVGLTKAIYRNFQQARQSGVSFTANAKTLSSAAGHGRFFSGGEPAASGAAAAAAENPAIAGILASKGPVKFHFSKLKK